MDAWHAVKTYRTLAPRLRRLPTRAVLVDAEGQVVHLLGVLDRVTTERACEAHRARTTRARLRRLCADVARLGLPTAPAAPLTEALPGARALRCLDGQPALGPLRQLLEATREEVLSLEARLDALTQRRTRVEAELARAVEALVRRVATLQTA